MLWLVLVLVLVLVPWFPCKHAASSLLRCLISPVLLSGHQLVELPDERTLRWLTLHIRFTGPNQRLSIQTPRVQSWMFDVRAQTSYFNSSDPTLNAIVKLSTEFIYLGMSDTFVDTPGREDGQWMEDAR